MIEGLGYIFASSDFKAKLLRLKCTPKTYMLSQRGNKALGGERKS
jgi:hypothetical protein